MSLDSMLQKLWYGPAWRSMWLWPLSALFALTVLVRRVLYCAGLLRSFQVPAPVIVVGNLTVGGTGKTPLVIWLANQLQTHGRRVGIVTRGYGGQARTWPQRVQPDSAADQVGDEAVLLAMQTGAIVCAGPDRVADAQMAIELGADVIISDDGLQHYRLRRDVELAVVDAARGLGNGCYLPAGPLREGRARLSAADVVLLNMRNDAQQADWTNEPASNWLRYRTILTGLCGVKDGKKQTLESLRGHAVHVVTGIGHPEAFIRGLRDAGMNVQSHVLPDHARFEAQDIQFADSLPVLMTGKDAVKCRHFADERHMWVTVDLQFNANDARRLLELVEGKLGAPQVV